MKPFTADSPACPPPTISHVAGARVVPPASAGGLRFVVLFFDGHLLAHAPDAGKQRIDALHAVLVRAVAPGASNCGKCAETRRHFDSRQRKEVELATQMAVLTHAPGVLLTRTIGKRLKSHNP
eukprot:354917-Chlamydomonas_euryale.AAC.5